MQDEKTNQSTPSLYSFIKENGLTDKSEGEFYNTYADSAKAKELYNFMQENKLTDKDFDSFYTANIANSGYKADSVAPKEEPKKNNLSDAELKDMTYEALPTSVKMMNAALGTTASIAGQGIMKLPKLISDVVETINPVNIVFDHLIDNQAEENGLPKEQADQIKQQYRQASDATLNLGKGAKALADSKAATWLTDKSKELENQSQVRKGESITSLIGQGDIGDAAAKIGVEISRSLPYTLTALGGGAVGLAAMGATTASTEYDNIKDEDSSQAAKLIEATLNGAAEALGEYIGTQQIGKFIAKSFKTVGAKQAAEQLQNGVEKFMQNIFKKYGLFAQSVAEGTSEFATTIAQNAAAKYTGVDPARNLMDGAGDSFIVGAAQGGLMGGAGKVGQKIYRTYKTKQYTNQIDNELSLITHESGNVIQVQDKQTEPKNWHVVKGDLNNPSDMLFLVDPENPTAPPVIKSINDLNQETIQAIPATQLRQQKLDELKIQFDAAETVLNEKQNRKTEAANERKLAEQFQTGKMVQDKQGNVFIVTESETGSVSTRPMVKNEQTGQLEEADLEAPTRIFKGKELQDLALYGEKKEEAAPITDETAPSTDTPQTDIINEQKKEPTVRPIVLGSGKNAIETRVITHEDGRKQIGEEFTDEDSVNKIVDLVKKHNKLSEKYDVEVTKEDPNPDDEFSDYVWKVFLKPKDLGTSNDKIDEKLTKPGNISDVQTEKVAKTEGDKPAIQQVTKEVIQESSQKVEPTYLDGEQNLQENTEDTVHPPAAKAVAPITTGGTRQETPTQQDGLDVVAAEDSETKKTINRKQASQKKGLSKNRTAALKIEVFNAHDLALQWFIAGGKINRSALNDLYGTKGQEDNPAVRRKVEAERKQRFTWVSDKDGFGIKAIAHQLWEENSERFDDTQFREAVEDIINSFTSPEQMAVDLLSRNGQKEQQLSLEEVAELETWEKGQDERLMVEEQALIDEIFSENISIFVGDLSTQEWVNIFYPEYGNKETDEGRDVVEPAVAGNEDQQGDGGRPIESIGKGQENTDGKEITVYQQQINDLTKKRDELILKRKRKEAALNDRNGLFGDTKTDPNDLFGGQGFDASQIPVALKSIDDEIETVNLQIEKLKKQNSTGQKEAAGQLAIDQQIEEQKPNENPTEGQKEAGNYKKAHITVQGMDISIENPKGSTRSGVDPDGNKWSHEMKSHYGYFNRTEGKDGDHIDVFIGEMPDNETLFVIDQIDPQTGKFDESKVMLGYESAEQAKAAYLENYDKDWKGFSAITPVNVEDFKKWLYDGARQRKPYSEYKQQPENVNKIQSWLDKWNELKTTNDPKELDLFYNKVKVALNGIAQGKNVVAEFEALKKEIEDYASGWKKQQQPESPKQKEVEEKKSNDKNDNFVKNNNDEISESVSQGEPGALHEENSGTEEISDQCKGRIQKALRDAQEAEGTLSRERKQEIEQRTTEQFAKEKGLWIPLKDTLSLGETLPAGSENDVYLNQEQGEVYKVNNLTYYGESIDSFLDTTKIHNELFPATKYELVGFTGVDGRSIMPVVKQSYIREAEPATPKEILEYMQALGFTKISDRSFTNGQYTISDLLPRNVLKSNGGNIYVIDNIIKLNEEKKQSPVQEEVQPEFKYQKKVNPKDRKEADKLVQRFIELANKDNRTTNEKVEINQIVNGFSKLNLDATFGEDNSLIIEGENLGGSHSNMDGKNQSEEVQPLPVKKEPEVKSPTSPLDAEYYDMKAKEKKQSDKAAKAQKDVDDALKDFLDAFNDLNNDNLGIVDNTAEKQAKMLVAGTKLIGAYTKAGVYKFGEIMASIKERGIAITEELLSALKKAYGAFVAENDIEELDDIKTVRNFKMSDLTQDNGISDKKDVTLTQQNNKQDVPDRTGNSEQHSPDNTDDLSKNEGTVSGQRGTSGQTGGQTSSGSKKGNGGRTGSKSGSGLFGTLFGEQNDNEVYPNDGQPIVESDDAGDFDGRGSRTDSTEGLNDGQESDLTDDKNAETVSESFKEQSARKLKQQKAAEPIPVKVGDIDNIRQTLPFLLDEQQDDVLKAETRFFSAEHNTKERAFGKGMLFTNGTGTGKTYTGLGIIKRFVKQGKKNILIVVPSQPKVLDWSNDGKNLGLDITPLPDTSTGGTGVVVTTYANFRENDELKKREFDLIIYDESHRIMEDKKGNTSSTTLTHYQISNKDEWSAFSRLTDVHPVWIEYKNLFEKYKEANKGFNANMDLMDWQVQDHIAKVKKMEARLDELEKQKKELEPGLQAKAKEAVERTKVVFLSATPFKSHFNLRYANGILFDWGNETTYESASRGQSRVDPESRFFLDNFGGAYEWKYHRLQTRQNANAEAIAMQEVQFAEKLMAQGVVSGRTINSERDYGRAFPKVTGINSETFNEAFGAIFNYQTNEFDGLRSAAREVFYSYNYTTQLLESLKTSASIDRIRKHLGLGRKVVIFHRRKQANSRPPFEMILNMTESNANAVLSDKNSRDEEKEKAKRAIEQVSYFRSRYNSLLEYEKTLNYRSAIDQIITEFGDRTLYINGDVNKKDKSEAIRKFNDDNSGVDIIVVQEESGKEGISLHDTTGNHQRVLMSMSMPISSTTALQIEGRIYRIGQETDAIFEYPLLGLDFEIEHFGRNINRKLSTTENLAVGEQSRDLIRAFAEGVLDNSETEEPNNEQGKGGKAYDRRLQKEYSDFRRAVLVYNTNQKKRGRRDSREGIDYYPTPEPVGQKMVEWLGLQPQETGLEPSAGHGAIAMWFPNHSKITAIEPSFALFSKLNARSGGGDRRIINDTFENLDIVNKYNGVAMNPPFGVGGKMAMDHLEKAFHHLKEGGRIVALIPNGGSMQKRLDDFLYGTDKDGNLNNPTAALIAEIKLPSVTFQQAGTTVNAKIVVIDKMPQGKTKFNIRQELYHEYSTQLINNEIQGFPPVEEVNAEVERRHRAQIPTVYTQRYDLSSAEKIDDLFDEIEHIDIQGRPKMTESAEAAPQAQAPAAEVSKSDYEVFEQKDTRNGATLYMANPKAYLGDDYKKVSEVAKKYGGYYSTYQNKAENVRKGFLFKTEEQRKAFLSEVENKDDDIRFRLIGEKGASNLDKAEEATTRLDNLNVARQMETELGITESDWKTKGAKEEEKRKLLMQTGWNRGVDLKWRYEVPDIDIDPSFEKLTWGEGSDLEHGSSTSTPLENAISGDNLFKEYPQLRNVSLRIIPGKKGGSYAKAQYGWPAAITIGFDPKTKQLDRSVLIHEIQHAIQEIEGFATGGNPQQLMNIISFKDKKLIEDYESGIAHYFKTKEGKEVDKIIDTWINENPNFTDEQSNALDKDIVSKYPSYQTILDALSEIKKNRNLPENSQEAYLRLAGETESRNTQSRAYLSEQDRKNTLLEETADVANEDQIIIFDGLGASNMITEDPKRNAAETLAKELNTEVEILESAEGLTGKKATAKGWFDPKTGRVTVILSNNTNEADVQRTIMHEIVGHRGLRGLLGNNFEPVMNKVFDSLPDYIQKQLEKAYPGKSHSYMAEEYASEMAETLKDPSLLQRIVSAFKSALRGIGINLNMSDADIAYLLWRSKNRLQEGENAFDMAEKTARGKKVEKALNNIFAVNYRKVEMSSEELAKKEFYKKYEYQHKDIRSKKEGNFLETLQQIQETGFRGGAYVIGVYKGGKPDNIIQSNYGNKKGDVIYLVPKEWVKTPKLNPYTIKEGWKPNDEDVIVIEYDNQSSFEAYQNKLKKQSEIPPTILVNGKERPTTNSKGQAIHPTLEGIKSFYKWFGESTTVNEKGEPIVFYHGTDREVKEFNTDVIFATTDARQATSFAKEKALYNTGRFDDYTPYPSVLPLYIKTLNTFHYKNEDDVDAVLNLSNNTEREKESDKNEILSGDWMSIEQYKNEIRNAGFDGFYVKETWLSNLAVFSPNQIKSATGNNGEFSPESDNILFRSGDKIVNKKPIRSDFNTDNEFNEAMRAWRNNELSKKLLDTKLKQANQVYHDRKRAMTLFEELIVKLGGKVDNEHKPSTEYNFAIGRKIQRHEALHKHEVKNFMEALGELAKIARLTPEQINEYLQAKHAPERNKYIREQLIADVEKRFQKYSDEYDGTVLVAQGMLNNGSLTQKKYDDMIDVAQRKLDKARARADKKINAINNEVFSGYSDKKADQIVHDVEKNVPVQVIEQVWNTKKALSDKTVDYAFEYGRIDKATHDELKNRYQWYIPLRGWSEEYGEEYDYYGSDINGHFSNPFKQAHGRKSIADDPVGYLIKDAESMIASGENNRVKKAFLNMFRDNIDILRDAMKTQYVYEEAVEMTDENGDPYTEWVVMDDRKPDPAKLLDGTARYAKSGMNMINATKEKIKQSTVLLYENGKPVTMTLTGLDPELARFLNMIESPTVKSANDFFTVGPAQKWAKWTRRMGSLYTSANPIFAIKNHVRDIQTMLATEFIEEGMGDAVQALGNIPLAYRAIVRFNRGETKGKNTNYVREFYETGVAYGYRNIMSIEQHNQAFKDFLNEYVHGKRPDIAAKHGLLQLHKGVQGLSDYFEQAVRVAVFMHYRKEGLSAREAGKKAEDTTINFKTRGSAAIALNSTWAFTSVALEAAAKTMRYFEGSAPKKIRASVAMMMPIALGYLAYTMAMSAMAGDDDDDDVDKFQKIAPYEWENNLILIPKAFGIDSDKYIKIPIPPFFRKLWGMGVRGAKVNEYYATDGHSGYKPDMLYKQIPEIISDMTPLDPMQIFDANGEATWKRVLATLTPTAMKPAAEVALNTTYSGQKLIPDQNPFAKSVVKADALMHFRSTNKALAAAAEGLYQSMGGNESGDKDVITPEGEMKTIVSINPAYIQHLTEGYLGGYGKIALSAAETAYAATQDKDKKELEQLKQVVKGDRVLTPIIKDYVGRFSYDPITPEYFKAVKSLEKRSGAIKAYLDDYRMSEGSKLYRIYGSEMEQFKANQKIIKMLKDPVSDDRINDREAIKNYTDRRRKFMQTVIDLERDVERKEMSISQQDEYIRKNLK